MYKFIYVEFENLEPSGHRLNTVNFYAAALRNFDLFSSFYFLGRKYHNESGMIFELFRDYNVIALELSPLSLPNEQKLNIHNVSNEIVEFIRKIDDKRDSLFIYTHMPSPFALLSLYLAIRSLNLKRDVKVLVRICMTDEEWSWYRVKLSSIIKLIYKDPKVFDKFIFTFESKRLIDYYRSKTGYEFNILQFNPFPRADLIRTKFKHRSHLKIYGSKINFLFIGEAREEKGYHLLPNFIEKLIESNLKFSFRIHSFSNPANDTDLIKDAREKLLKLSLDKNYEIQLIMFPLSDIAYRANLAQADVIVMPYSEKSYKIRGSGIAFEAICNNCFILVTPNTDIAETFSDSKRIFTYDFSVCDISPIYQLYNKIMEERSVFTLDHPAHLYESSFFENVTINIIRNRNLSMNRVNIISDEFLIEKLLNEIVKIENLTDLCECLSQLE